jgi:hypothetical protein
LIIGSAVATDAPGRKTGKNEVARDHEVDDDIEGALSDHSVEGDCLRDRAGEAVEDIAPDASVVVVEAV